MSRRWAVVAVAAVLMAGCSGGGTAEPRLLPFTDSVDRDEAEALLSMEADGVTIDVYDDGDCVIVVEYVPDYGYLEDEFCPAEPGRRFGTPNCPVGDFGDECQRWLPVFDVGRTIEAAAYVCVETGRIEVRNGWWLSLAADVQSEAVPLNADGVRLDSVSNEFDDQMRAACDARDPELVEALLEIRTGDYKLPITVELDVGVSGSFLLHSRFEPYVFETGLPVGAAPMQVVVIEDSEGTGIGTVAVPAMPECENAVFILDLAGPSGSWICQE